MTEPPATVGRYHVERLIAHGGMGSLYLARDPAIDRLLVIKLLREGFDDDAARERFTREARAAGRLHHRNIVTVFDVGEHDNRPFIAMEYVAGETLAQLIRRRGVSRLWQKLAILEDLCDGLHYAHGAGIIHRDIKPANVMRDESGMVRILDFGVARAGGTGMTRAGDVVGTLNYMSPEQLAGEDVDHRCDVYAVGALAYELITNQMAFPGTIHTGVLSQILNSTPVPIERLVPGIDPDITVAIERAMARELDVRYQDLEALRRDLAVVRARLFATLEIEEAADPEAETLVGSSPIASGTQSRPASRASEALHRSGTAAASRPSTQVISPWYRPTRIVFLGVASAAVVVALAAILMFNRARVSSPAVQTDSTAQPQPTPRAPAPGLETAPPAPANIEQIENQLRDARVTARQQIAAGQRQVALETLIRGLTLEPKDADLNSLLAELARVARQTAIATREAASRRGATPDASVEFRDGESRQRDADNLLRAGDRAAGIRALWAAAELYNKARGARGRTASAAPAPAAITQPVDPLATLTSQSPANPATPPVSPVPSPESLKPTPPQVDKPPPVTEPERKPETPPAVPDPGPDPRAADVAAIRQTLRRYTEAYQSLDAAAVGQVMPSLTAEQLRSLGRDFSNYRSYTVEIQDERIAVNGLAATVMCRIVRSFETKSGVAGSNSVQSIFHLRRSGSAWTIERLESR